MATTNAVTLASLITADPRATGGELNTHWALWRIFNAESITSTNTVNSVFSSTVNGIPISEYKYFGLWFQLAGSTPSVTLNVTQSFDDTAGNYVIPAAVPVIVASLTSTNPQVYSLTPTPLPWLRFQLVGTGTNGSDTTATLYFWAQQ